MTFLFKHLFHFCLYAFFLHVQYSNVCFFFFLFVKLFFISSEGIFVKYQTLIHLSFCSSANFQFTRQQAVIVYYTYKRAVLFHSPLEIYQLKVTMDTELSEIVRIWRVRHPPGNDTLSSEWLPLSFPFLSHSSARCSLLSASLARISRTMIPSFEFYELF